MDIFKNKYFKVFSFLIGIPVVLLSTITLSQPKYLKITKEENIYTENKSYLLCRRPLAYTSMPYNFLFKRNYSANNLDNSFEHHHFFLIEDTIYFDNNDSNTMSQIWDFYKDYTNFPQDIIKENSISYNDLPITLKADKLCEKNDFRNFGFFDNHHIECNQNIKDYTECHIAKYDEETMKRAIQMMQRDLIKYSLYPDNNNSQYNCQTFTKHMVSAYQIIEENMGFACPITFSEHNPSRFNSIKNNIYILLDIPITNKKTKFKYNWQTNPYYNKKTGENGDRLDKNHDI